MTKKNSDPNVIALDDLERRVFWYSLVVLIGLVAAALGATMLMGVTQKSLDQVVDLSDRVERLTPTAAPSEPAKT